MRALAVLTLSLFAVCGASCQSVTPAGTLFASDPPGATVLLDGQDSGFVTPCMIALDRKSSHDVRLQLPGYAEERFTVHPEDRVVYIPWMAGNASTAGLTFLMFLPFWDIVLPIEIDQSFRPGRVHVRLRPQTGE